ncbi:MAG: cysteine hydrolase [candidate division WOR-3 bacterium]|nr:cysteine hydrolase [candidate division WOR-3 bacterium]MCX7947313.1 cysteine hydrolase [candidate division WOR-3 bacterium]MDW8150131.1 isochorismatase family cysteine hydrolase [candidate division WOR-3 bacterium]
MSVSIELSENVSLDAGSSAIIVVDMQNDFCDEKGSLFVIESRKTIEPISKLLEKARKKNVKIFYTQDTHQEDDLEFNIWPKHAIEGSWGWEIIPELKPRAEDIIIRKLRYDAFYGTNLEHYLRIYNIKNLVIVGTVANICVLHTAGSAALRWFNVIVPIDCISAINEFDYNIALRQVNFLYKGILTKSEYIQFS